MARSFHRTVDINDPSKHPPAGDRSDILRVETLSGTGMGVHTERWEFILSLNPDYFYRSREFNQTIYLNPDYLSEASKEQIFVVVNKRNAQGDEGESFGRILEGGRLSSRTVELISGSSSVGGLRGRTASGLVLDTQSSLLATRDFSSRIFDSAQPIMRCGCSTCMQKISDIDQSRKANKYSDFPPNNPSTLDASHTWQALPDDNSYINGLMTGSKWGAIDPDSGVGITLDYYFFSNESLPDGAWGYLPYQQEQDAAINAMTAYSSVANISFARTESFNDANISWAFLDSADSGSGTLGYAYTPESGGYSGITTVNWEHYTNLGGIIGGSIDPGSYYFLTFTHELGHALGLKHPHDLDYPYDVFPGVSSSGDGGDNELNAGPWTVMTYNDSTANNGFSPTTDSYSGFLTGLGAFDIAAVQYLYGANLSTNTGNNIYRISDLNGFSCIWDNGGIDRIDASDLTTSVAIDLRNATLQESPGGGGFASRIDNTFKGYTIAYNSTGTCIIENAVGGSAADGLIGNSANNVLNGKGGADVMAGGKGNDTYIVDNAKDVVSEGSGAGTDTVNASVSHKLRTNVERLILTGTKAINGTGNDLNNRLTGNSANNVLNGKRGADVMAGGKGNDTYIVDNAKDVVSEGSGAGTDTVNASVSHKLRTNVERLILTGTKAINGTGNGLNNRLTGNSANNVLNGGGGNDLFIGGGGKDRVWGQGGRDTFRVVRGIGYTVIEDFRNGQDRIQLGTGASGLQMQNRGDDVYLYQRGDLMAIVEDAAGDLQRSGSYLV